MQTITWVTISIDIRKNGCIDLFLHIFRTVPFRAVPHVLSCCQFAIARFSAPSVKYLAVGIRIAEEGIVLMGPPYDARKKVGTADFFSVIGLFPQCGHLPWFSLRRSSSILINLCTGFDFLLFVN